ncbi:MAG: TetR/AcrR family transcriptional regulator [Ilumatobacteraceae bacterium]
MNPRAYQLGKRIDSVEETRRRIVMATFEVHDEKGIADTKFRDIAERADVSLATVYRHFPTYDAIVEACGELSRSMLPPLEPAVFDGVSDLRSRLRLLADSIGQRLELLGDWEWIRNDARKVAPLRRFIAEFHDETCAFTRAALGEYGDDNTVAIVVALVDAAVYRLLREGGQPTVEVLTDVVGTWLEHRKPAISGQGAR